MKKHLLAITLLIISIALNAQQWTKERVKTELQKKEFLNNPEMVNTLERVFAHQEELGGVRLVGMKTSAQVAQEYYKNVYFDYIAEIVYSDTNNTQNAKKTDQEMQDFIDNHLEKKLNDIVNLTIRNFADWAVGKYGIKYPKLSLTDEQAIANSKKVPNGIYYKTKNKSAGKDSFERAQDPYYVIVNNGRAYRLKMQNEDYETGIFNYRIYPTDFRVAELDGKSFKTVWLNDNPTHGYFAYNTEVIDLFEPVSSEIAQAFYGMLGNMESTKKKGNNRFIGSWRCVQGYANNEHKNSSKVFGDDYHMQVHFSEQDDDIEIHGRYMTVKYLPDGNVAEGAGVSEINWIDDNTYTLIWKAGGKTFTEKWVRQPLPEKVISFIKNTMTVKSKAKPMPKDPREMLAMLEDMEDMPEKWKGYTQILNMPEANTPEGWYLKASALLCMAKMQNNDGKKDKAAQLAKQATEVAAGHESDNSAEAMNICYQIHNENAYMTLFNLQEDYRQTICEELEMAQSCLDEFGRLAPKEAAKWQKELATIDENSTDLSYSLLGIYTVLGQYKKAVMTGNKALQAWNRTSEESKNENLYTKYIILTKMLEAARLSGNTVVFEKCANELTAFLADVSEKSQKGEVSMDEDTRFFMLHFCTTLISEYGKLHDYDRSEEYASLAMTFVPEERSRINYELCLSLIDNERYEEADQLHTELLKDTKFVNDHLKYYGDEAAGRLIEHIQPKEMPKVEEPVAVEEVKKDDEATQKKAEAQKKINAQLASVNNELKKAQGDDNHVKIKGYSASSTSTAQAKKDKNGRVALPVDSAKKAGVGIHFKF